MTAAQAGEPAGPRAPQEPQTPWAPLVVLIGPPGAGKTAVGPHVAARLGVPFRDTDAEVGAAAGKPVSDIFIENGEEAFRALEREAVARALDDHGIGRPIRRADLDRGRAHGGSSPSVVATRAAIRSASSSGSRSSVGTVTVARRS